MGCDQLVERIQSRCPAVDDSAKEASLLVGRKALPQVLLRIALEFAEFKAEHPTAVHRNGRLNPFADRLGGFALNELVAIGAMNSTHARQ